MRGIAHGAQDARADVVQQHPGNAQKVDPQIGRGRADHVVGRGHQAQHERRHEDAQHGEHGAHAQSQRDRGLHRAVQLLVLLRAVILRDHDARAGGETGEDADEHIDDRPRAAHGGQRLTADVVAHDDGVDRVVELLKDVADHQRQGEADEEARNAALGHVRIFFSHEGHTRGSFRFFSLSQYSTAGRKRQQKSRAVSRPARKNLFYSRGATLLAI